MKKLVVIIILVLNISVMSSIACSPEVSEYITVFFTECNEIDEVPNIDVMVKADGLREEEMILQTAKYRYAFYHRDYENYSYLQDEDYISHSAYLNQLEFRVDNCSISFISDEYNSHELPYIEFYVIYFDENGDEISRSGSYVASDFQDVADQYFLFDTENKSFSLEKHSAEGCRDAYNVVFGLLAFVGAIGLIIIIAVSFTITFAIVLITARTIKMNEVKKLIPIPIMSVMLILLYVFIGQDITIMSGAMFTGIILFLFSVIEIMILYATMKDEPWHKIVIVILSLNSLIALFLFSRI